MGNLEFILNIIVAQLAVITSLLMVIAFKK